MHIPMWLIVILVPVILGGIAVFVVGIFVFLDMLDEYLGLFGGRIHDYVMSRENARKPETVIENVIVKKSVGS